MKINRKGYIVFHTEYDEFFLHVITKKKKLAKTILKKLQDKERKEYEESKEWYEENPRHTQHPYVSQFICKKISFDKFLGDRPLRWV